MIDFTERLSRLSPHQLSELANQLLRQTEGRDQLVAFVVARSSVAEQELRSYCKQRLPDYMLPQRFELVDALPLTSTGKVDYKQLQATLLPSRGRATQPAGEAAAADTIEQNQASEISYDTLVARLTAVWCEVLQMDRILPDDDYFELGGDSIANLQIIARCAKFDIHFGPADLLQNPTIDLLARWLEQTTLQEATQPSVPPAEGEEAADATIDEGTKSEMLRVLNLGRDN